MSETVLLLGGGGREHAIARAIAASEVEHTLHAIAGNRNPGIVRLVSDFHEHDATDVERVTAIADEIGATIAVIGPEAPLEAGVSDALDGMGVYVFAPSRADARIETDKAWQREFMHENDIPGCPTFETFDDTADAIDFVESYDGDVAVKPRGLTGGKGVRVTGDQLSKAEAIEYMTEAAYDGWVVEERLIGEEFTVQAFVANGSIRVSPAVQDHKRAFEDDEGPNTGGMGSYSAPEATLPFMTDAEYDAAIDIIDATVTALDSYKGVLYGQFMLTADGPKVVEYNARFGDPEAMNTLPVLETDFLEIVTAARAGDTLPQLVFSPRATVCKYAVPEGYPTDPTSGSLVTVDEQTIATVNERYRDDGGEALLFYASVDERDDGIYTTTSRSFAVVGLAPSIDIAESIADDALSAAGEGVRIRHDIGKADLLQRRIDHMEQLRAR